MKKTDQQYHKARARGAFSATTLEDFDRLISLSKPELIEIAVRLAAATTGDCDNVEQAVARFWEERSCLRMAKEHKGAQAHTGPPGYDSLWVVVRLNDDGSIKSYLRTDGTFGPYEKKPEQSIPPLTYEETQSILLELARDWMRVSVLQDAAAALWRLAVETQAEADRVMVVVQRDETQLDRAEHYDELEQVEDAMHHARRRAMESFNVNLLNRPMQDYDKIVPYFEDLASKYEEEGNRLAGRADELKHRAYQLTADDQKNFRGDLLIEAGELETHARDMRTAAQRCEDHLELLKKFAGR